MNLTLVIHIVCQEFIQALEACHADGWSRWTGACNQAKHDLNMCLRKEVSTHACGYWSCLYVLTPVTLARRPYDEEPRGGKGTAREDRTGLERTPRRLDLFIPLAAIPASDRI